MSTATATRRPVARKPARTPHGTCRLTLFINGTAYGVKPLPCDPSLASRAFRLRKADGTAYAVAMTPHGACCDCADFEFNRAGIDPAGCKHIKSLIATGLMPTK